MMFRNRPEPFPGLYTNGVCQIAEIGAQQVENAPAPWSMRKIMKILGQRLGASAPTSKMIKNIEIVQSIKGDKLILNLISER